MNKPYPSSIPVYFEDYPVSFRVTLGPMAPLPFSYGSQVTLFRTPLCGVAQGPYVIGSPLPMHAMVYSDTGSDDVFDLKISDYGRCTFYVESIEDNFCKLEVLKGRKFECGGFSKKFERKEWTTGLPSSLVLSASDLAAKNLIKFKDTVPAESEIDYGNLTWTASIKYDSQGHQYLSMTCGLLELIGKRTK